MKAKVFLLLLVAVISLSLAKMAISYKLATSQEYSLLLEENKESLEREINELSSDIAKLRSLSVIAAKAKEQGLEKNDKVVNISPEVPVALSQ